MHIYILFFYYSYLNILLLCVGIVLLLCFWLVWVFYTVLCNKAENLINELCNYYVHGLENRHLIERRILYAFSLPSHLACRFIPDIILIFLN